MAKTMTPNMKRFIQKNKIFLVIAAQNLTKEGKPIRTKEDFENSDQTKYTFEDGTVMTMTNKDKKSAPNFFPGWKISPNASTAEPTKNMLKMLDDIDKKEPTHVDDFIDYGSSFSSEKREEHEDYARWVLNHFRLSAILKNAFSPFMKPFKLFCEYQGKKYRVIGASRLGDIWLTSDFEAEHGYEHRVSVDDVCNWSME